MKRFSRESLKNISIKNIYDFDKIKNVTENNFDKRTIKKVSTTFDFFLISNYFLF